MVQPKTFEKNSLQGHLLVAMPGMTDPRFAGTVSLVCYHNPEGTMAVILNRLIGTLNPEHIMKGLRSDIEFPKDAMRVHFGGPVMTDRGFIIHGTELNHLDSQDITDNISLSATTDALLKLLAQSKIPWRLALGCASWVPGQLEDEMRAGGWLTAEATRELVFRTELPNVWSQSLKSIGIAHPEMLVAQGGKA